MYEEVRNMIMRNKTLDRQFIVEKVSNGKKTIKYTIVKKELKYRVSLSFNDEEIDKCAFKDFGCLSEEKVPKFILRHHFKAPFNVNSKSKFTFNLNYITVANNIEEFLLSANTQYIDYLKKSIESYKTYKENPSVAVYNYTSRPSIFQKWNLPKDGSYTKITEGDLQKFHILKPSSFIPYKILILPSKIHSEIIILAYTKGRRNKIYRNKKHVNQDFKALVQEINSLFFD
ncbi:hypothetical protein SteCoe_16607 [Stentor coeruleus]|uniref:Uncharacterized protein n=1 Tax=Stentor coeruleus TaxID=5963 RepID=A0A1R2C0W5_9CILI|nr:hypothetical protein SteCoe_16607 [Stentor coeruleus]